MDRKCEYWKHHTFTHSSHLLLIRSTGSVNRLIGLSYHLSDCLCFSLSHNLSSNLHPHPFTRFVRVSSFSLILYSAIPSHWLAFFRVQKQIQLNDFTDHTYLWMNDRGGIVPITVSSHRLTLGSVYDRFDGCAMGVDSRYHGQIR